MPINPTAHVDRTGLHGNSLASSKSAPNLRRPQHHPQGVHHVPPPRPRPHQCPSTRTRGRSGTTPPRQEHPENPKPSTLATRKVSDSQLCADEFALTLGFTDLATSTNHEDRGGIGACSLSLTRSNSEIESVIDRQS